MNIGRETETVEFKESITQLDKGILSLTAMLNRSNTGTVYFGVDDDGNVVGMNITDSTLEKIRNAVRNDVQPRILVDVQIMDSDDGKRYIAMRSKGYDIPYSYDGRYYIRHGPSNESASPDLVAKMVLSRGYDSMREMDSFTQGLTFSTLNDMMSSRGLHPRPELNFYNSIGLLTKEHKFNLNAWILSDENNLIMQIVEFEGSDRSVFSKRTDHGNQCMFMSMKIVFDSLQSRNETKVDIISGDRIDTDLFDLDCFREAWYNACLHNSWCTGIPPLVAIFDDRIEIQSSGSMPYGIPMSDIYDGRSAPINNSLFRLAVMMGFVENTGHGIPTIVEKYGPGAVKVSEGSVTVIIPFAFEPSYVTARKNRVRNDIVLDEREQIILNYLRMHERAKISEISNDTGLNESGIKRTISSLKQKGLIENKGTNRNSIWAVLI